MPTGVDSLWPHGLQHARLPCPSPSLGVCSSSYPLNRWCHPTSSSSVTLFSCFQSFPATGCSPNESAICIRGQFTLIHVLNIPGSYAILFFIAVDFTFLTRHIHNRESCLLWPSCFLLSAVVSICPPLFCSNISNTFRPGGAYLLLLHLFAFLYSSWDSHEWHTGVVCHSVLQWFTFCQNSLLWPVLIGGPTWHGS